MGVDCEQCSCRLISRLQRLLTMHSGSKVLIFIVVGACQAARQLRVPADPLRGERSLLNTFPFSAIEDQESSQAARFAPSQNLKPRVDRQGSDATDVSFAAVAAASPGGDGKRCIDKVEVVEETEYDETVQCDHSYDRRCHTTYVTNYESQQEEECEENFRKNCFINYEKIAFNETVQVCRTPLVKDCDVQGPEICRTEYESECWTKQEEHEVEDDVVECETIQDEKCEDETSGYTPITGCTKEPRELCAPAGCGFKEGAEVCYDKT